jgi:two-component system cell cycle sensor histidine kinase/response regulator CckA
MTSQSGVKDANAVSEAPVERGTIVLAQRTELVGQLASTMANEFNNIMMALTTCAELELRRTSHAQKRNIEQILRHSARATCLVQKLLSFGGKQPAAPRSFALNPVVEEACKLLRLLAGEDIDVTVKLDPIVGAIYADPIEIEQLVLSLGLYARGVIDQYGKLAVTTELLNLDPKSFGSELREAGQYAMICLQHTPATRDATQSRDSQGAENQDFQLARAVAAVHSIVTERCGYIRVSSRPNQGTVFRIYFAAATPEPRIEPAEPALTKPNPSRKTVLIVEDDDAVRDPAAELLMMEGFKVLQARSGMEALRIVAESRSQLDLLITDIVMAEMTGNEVADELLRAHPGLHVLYMSGDADKVSKVGVAANGARTAVLQKPFRLNKLNEKLRELLGE